MEAFITGSEALELPFDLDLLMLLSGAQSFISDVRCTWSGLLVWERTTPLVDCLYGFPVAGRSLETGPRPIAGDLELLCLRACIGPPAAGLFAWPSIHPDLVWVVAGWIASGERQVRDDVRLGLAAMPWLRSGLGGALPSLRPRVN